MLHLYRQDAMLTVIAARTPRVSHEQATCSNKCCHIRAGHIRAICKGSGASLDNIDVK